MILSINPGSSSLKYKIFDYKEKELFLIKEVEIEIKKATPPKKYYKYLDQLFVDIRAYSDKITKIGVRVVHGGGFDKPKKANKEVLSVIQSYFSIAPLHNPYSFFVIKYCLKKMKKVSVYAVFDTSFFVDLSKEASTYPLPSSLLEKFKIKKYGFHGISHQYMSLKLDPEKKKKIITVHLGSGCSITATENGEPVETSLGFTPDAGLIMQTRSGDLDPGLVLFLVEKLGLKNAKQVIETKSGLSALTNTSGDMLNILHLSGQLPSERDYFSANTISNRSAGKESAKSALDLYIFKIIEYIGAYAAVLKGVDSIGFSGKIGAGSSYLRNRIMKELDWLKINDIMVIEPNEELAMAEQIVNL